eukprot:jgi/Chrzof1/10880/Cz05g15230.t1
MSGSAVDALAGPESWRLPLSYTLTSGDFLHSHADNVEHSAAGPLGEQPAAPHKGLWPLNKWDIGVFTLAVVVVFIAAGGGIGGGAVFVPLYMLIAGFATSQAVALSNITIMGGAIANFALNIHRRHPQLNQPLIDWDLIMVMEPTTILGALLGSYLNKVDVPG